jgi:hypothetical protein
VPASDWSRVDAAADPSRLVAGLDALGAEPFFAASKARMAALLVDTGAARVLAVGRRDG